MVDINGLYAKLKEDLRSRAGRNVLTFLVFLCISTVFWFAMSLNDEVQKDFKVPLELEEFPKDVTVISGNVPVVNVTVKDKGSTLAKFSWGVDPVLKVRYSSFSRPSDNTLVLTEAQLNSAVRSVFGSSASVVAIRPDSLHLQYTTNPGIPVRVIIDADISPSPQYEAFGAPKLSSDSVMLFSNLRKRHHIKELTTEPISLSELTDTTTVEAHIIVPEGMRAIPSTIRVTFPIEPLVSKTREFKVEAVNVPHGRRLIPFPSVIEVSYLLPKSLYSSDSSPIKVEVDYNDIKPGQNTLPVHLVSVPSYYKSAQALTSEVEYLIETSNP